MILCSVAEAVGFFVGLTAILWWISSKFEEIISEVKKLQKQFFIWNNTHKKQDN